MPHPDYQRPMRVVDERLPKVCHGGHGHAGDGSSWGPYGLPVKEARARFLEPHLLAAMERIQKHLTEEKQHGDCTQ